MIFWTQITTICIPLPTQTHTPPLPLFVFVAPKNKSRFCGTFFSPSNRKSSGSCRGSPQLPHSRNFEAVAPATQRNLPRRGGCRLEAAVQRQLPQLLSSSCRPAAAASEQAARAKRRVITRRKNRGIRSVCVYVLTRGIFPERERERE